MTLSKRTCLSASLGLALLAAATLPAQAVEPGGYIGMGFGESDDEILNETDSGWKIFGGHNFDRNLGFELAFVDFGEFSGGALEQDGLAFQLVGYLPVTPSFDLFGKVGIFDWEVRAFGLVDTGVDPTYGVGGEVRIGPRAALRAEWEAFSDVSGGDVDLLSIGLSLRF